MVNRRQFIEAGTAASVAAALAGAAIGGFEGIAAQPAPRGYGTRPQIVLFDERFAAARRFGATMRRRGLAVHAIRGDVTDIWYSRLYPMWKTATAPVAGLTAYAAMFCLERLAWDHGLRMVRLDGAAPPLHAWLIAAPAATAARNG